MNSTPQEEWDNWYSATHPSGKPSWELTDDDTSIEEPEFEDNGT